VRAGDLVGSRRLGQRDGEDRRDERDERQGDA
jgi:hypothetical protein